MWPSESTCSIKRFCLPGSLLAMAVIALTTDDAAVLPLLNGSSPYTNFLIKLLKLLSNYLFIIPSVLLLRGTKFPEDKLDTGTEAATLGLCLSRLLFSEMGGWKNITSFKKAHSLNVGLLPSASICTHF